MPAKPYKPEHKGKIENGVVRGGCGHFLYRVVNLRDAEVSCQGFGSRARAVGNSRDFKTRDAVGRQMRILNDATRADDVDRAFLFWQLWMIIDDHQATGSSL